MGSESRAVSATVSNFDLFESFPVVWLDTGNDACWDLYIQNMGCPKKPLFTQNSDR
jgi:hypothetical protein